MPPPPARLIPIRAATLRRGQPIRLAEYAQQLIISPGGRSAYVLGDTGLVTRISTRHGPDHLAGPDHRPRARRPWA